MANGFVANAHRVDPYKNFKFRVIMNDKVVLGVTKVGSLKRTTEVISHRSGGDDTHETKSPGKSTFDAVSMERGITHDREFEVWANMVHQYNGDASMDLVNYKRDLILEHLNELGQVAYRYFLRKCWVSEFTATPEFDASANAIAIESLKIEVEGWERDTGVTEPDEAGAVPAV